MGYSEIYGNILKLYAEVERHCAENEINKNESSPGITEEVLKHLSQMSDDEITCLDSEKKSLLQVTLENIFFDVASELIKRYSPEDFAYQNDQGLTAFHFVIQKADELARDFPDENDFRYIQRIYERKDFENLAVEIGEKIPSTFFFLPG
ncbi:MAG: hypothetical protein ACI8RA_000024 [Chlamydiales bacterium]|jgi:hypothetical protein